MNPANPNHQAVPDQANQQANNHPNGDGWFHWYGTNRGLVELRFQDHNEKDLWVLDTARIKNQIALINNGLERAGRAGQGTVNDYQPWLNAVHAYHQRWGNRVAPDIQEACHDVQTGLGLPLTIF